MRHDLVDRQHCVRRRHDQILEPSTDRRRGAVLHRLGGDTLHVLEHLRVADHFVAGRLWRHREGARLEFAVLARRHGEAGRGAVDLLLDVRTFGRGQVLPLVVERHLRLDAEHARNLQPGLVDLHQEGDLVVERHVFRLHLDRHAPVVGVGRHRRERDLEALADRAGLGHVGGLRGELLDLGLGHERAAGKAPHAAVDDAHAEAGALFVATGAKAEAVGDDAVAHGHAVVDVAGEANVGVGAAQPPGFGQGDIRQPLELRLQHLAARRLRDQIATQVAGIQRDTRGAQRLDEIASLHGCPTYTAGEMDVMVKSSSIIGGTSAVPGLS